MKICVKIMIPIVCITLMQSCRWIEEDYSNCDKEVTLDTTVEWEEGMDVGGITIDRIYTLTISETLLELPFEVPDNKEITIKTDHPLGWNFVPPAGVSWITDLEKDNDILRFNVAANGSGSAREAYIRIEVGNPLRIVNTIKVIQNGS